MYKVLDQVEYKGGPTEIKEQCQHTSPQAKLVSLQGKGSFSSFSCSYPNEREST